MWQGRAGQPTVNFMFFVEKKFTVRFRLATSTPKQQFTSVYYYYSQESMDVAALQR
jgi:hypothetical protein